MKIEMDEAATESSDHALVRRVIDGDQGAFAVLYDKYHSMIARRLRRILGNPSDVEDLTQITFQRAFVKLGRWDESRPLGPWLWGIAYNVTGDWLRARRRRAWLSFGGDEAVLRQRDEHDPSAASQVEAKNLARLLYAAMDRLPARQRIAYTLHEIEGLGFSEIAELTGASPQTTRARVLTAQKLVKKRLRRLLAERGQGPPSGGEP